MFQVRQVRANFKSGLMLIALFAKTISMLNHIQQDLSCKYFSISYNYAFDWKTLCVPQFLVILQSTPWKVEIKPFEKSVTLTKHELWVPYQNYYSVAIS